MKHLCIWLIRFYQKYISPRKARPTCRFCPSCSSFAIEAFEKRGFFAGLLLTFFRILRCNPFCPGGYDPVPQTGITVRSYWATHGRERFDDPDAPDNDDTEGQAHETADMTADVQDEPLPNGETVPAAGGKQTDRGETAAVSDDAPRVACVKYIPEDKTPR